MANFGHTSDREKRGRGCTAKNYTLVLLNMLLVGAYILFLSAVRPGRVLQNSPGKKKAPFTGPVRVRFLNFKRACSPNGRAEISDALPCFCE
jgi:hypothetical protein